MRIKILFFLMILQGLCYAQYKGDGLGNHKARKPLDMNNQRITNSPDLYDVGSSTDYLNVKMNGLAGTQKRWFFTLNDDTLNVPEYYLTRSTIPSSSKTFKRTLSAATSTTPIFISTWTIGLGSFLTVPAGAWYCEIYSSMSAGTASLAFVVYDGSGTAMNYNNVIGTTSMLNADSNYTEWDKLEKRMYFEKQLYVMKSTYVSVALIAYESNTPNRTMYWSAGGIYDAHLLMPAILSDISVVSINGRTGDVNGVVENSTLKSSTENMVTTNTNQTITANKTFTSSPTVIGDMQVTHNLYIQNQIQTGYLIVQTSAIINDIVFGAYGIGVGQDGSQYFSISYTGAFLGNFIIREAGDARATFRALTGGGWTELIDNGVVLSTHTKGLFSIAGNTDVSGSMQSNTLQTLTTSYLGGATAAEMYGLNGSSWVGKVTADNFSGNGSQITELLSANMDNWYSTSTIACIIVATDTAGELGLSTVTLHIDNDYTVKAWFINSVVSDTLTVWVSTSGDGIHFGKVSGTDPIVLTGATYATSSALTNWITTMGADGWVRFIIVTDTPVDIRNASIGLKVWKWAK